MKLGTRWKTILGVANPAISKNLTERSALHREHELAAQQCFDAVKSKMLSRDVEAAANRGSNCTAIETEAAFVGTTAFLALREWASSEDLHVGVDNAPPISGKLFRGLSDEENRGWSFYRAASANPRAVWGKARDAWTERGLQDKDAAALLGYSPKRLSKALAVGRPLQFEAAARLTTALNVPGGPEALLPSPKSNDQQPSR